MIINIKSKLNCLALILLCMTQVLTDFLSNCPLCCCITLHLTHRDPKNVQPSTPPHWDTVAIATAQTHLLTWVQRLVPRMSKRVGFG